MDAEEYSHVFPTWEVYPRVYYFRSRYLDFNVRFERVMKALPERFHMKAPNILRDKLIHSLENKLHVMVLGEEDLSNSALTASHQVLKRYADVPFTSAEEIHACVCYFKATDLNETTAENISSVLNYLASSLKNRISFIADIFIVCATNSSLSDVETELFRKSIVDLVPKSFKQSMLQVQTLVGQNTDDLSPSISKSLEKQIMNGFLEIFSYLQTFVRIDHTCVLENLNILKSENVTHAIRNFLRTGYHLIDSKAITENDSILERAIEILCNRIRCAAVSPMASKHCIPEWVCHELFEELSFEANLQKSVTSKTRSHLEKACGNALELVQLKAEGKYVETAVVDKIYKNDYILYILEEDLAECVTSIEKNIAAMNQLTVVIKKMIFEVKGYLKQTIVEIEIIEIVPRDLTSDNISDKLRTEIIASEGVYGMGILYGQLEIHLKTGLDEKDILNVKSIISNILKNHQFPYPYTIKTVGENPRAFAKDFLESGQKVLSPCPEDEKDIRVGTLACFIKDSNDEIYALTCAHVVDPGVKRKAKVYIRTQDNLLGYSNAALTINVNENENTGLADIAAIKMLPDNEKLCNFQFQDESGHSHIGRIHNVPSIDVVGSYVFKIGASTGCTHGIITSNSYCSTELPKHIILVEPLPLISDALITAMANCKLKTTKEEMLPESNDSSSPTLIQESLFTGSIEMSPPHTKEDVTVVFTDSLTSDTQVDMPSEIQNEMLSASSGTNTKNILESLHETCYRQVAECVGEVDVNTSRKISRIHGVFPRPEHQNGQDIRDSDLSDTRNTNELLSEAFSSKPSFDSQVFATHGDSGAVVCRRNLVNNEIELISMVTAGDFKVNDPQACRSESKKCISIYMKEVLNILGENCKKNFYQCS